MSPLDDLLPSSRSGKVPINKMANRPPATTAAFGQATPQTGVMPRPNVLAGTTMMAPIGQMAPATPMQGMMGGPPVMGGTGMMANPGMLGSQGMLGNTGMGQPLKPTATASSQNGDIKKLSSQELADFLG